MSHERKLISFDWAIDEWIYFFKNETIKDEFTAQGLKEAKEELDILKMSEEERHEYEAYQESLRYQASMFESTYKVGEMKGLKQGIEVGRKEGQKDKTLEMAKKLKEIGMELPLIAKVSGLSQDEIMNL
jgi:predicted transposase/invertase (TIGR01784 family)